MKYNNLLIIFLFCLLKNYEFFTTAKKSELKRGNPYRIAGTIDTSIRIKQLNGTSGKKGSSSSTSISQIDKQRRLMSSSATRTRSNRRFTRISSNAGNCRDPSHRKLEKQAKLGINVIFKWSEIYTRFKYF